MKAGRSQFHGCLLRSLDLYFKIKARFSKFFIFYPVKTIDLCSPGTPVFLLIAVVDQ